MSRGDKRGAGMVLQDCVDLDALEQDARRRMPPASWVFCDTGADDEITAKDNVVAWRRLKLRPRVLRDIAGIDTGVSLLGARVNTPVMIAPTGRHSLFHPEGELATARVEGTISGAEIAIAEGAVIHGGMHMTGAARVTRFTEKRKAPSGTIEEE